MTDSPPDVLSELEEAWRTTDRLFDLLADEAALFEAPLPLRHPFVFYLGHMPAFGWNQVARGALGRGELHREFDELFERGIDPPDEEAARSVAVSDWPTIDAILGYRDRARAELRALLPAVSERGDDPLCEGLRVYHLVLEHELMHHETLLYILQELAPDQKRAPQGAEPVLDGHGRPSAPVAIPAGPAIMGADFDTIPFGWDNEFPRSEVRVDSFSIDRLPVTANAFLEFVEAGGYERESLWRPAHWAWIRSRERSAPHAWIRDGSDWLHRTMFGAIPLDDAGGWPAFVSCAEAEAFARWKGARLPTEAEIRRAAYGTPDGGERLFPWGDDVPNGVHGNFGLAHFDPLPVGSHPAGASAFGVEELVGNGWEWTATDFGPLPGFEAWMRTYPGYSADFFDDRHAVLFGAAWPTHPRLLRKSFRNWFRRTYPWVFATFRLAY